MQALQSQSFVSSDSTAMDDLHDFLRQRRQVAQAREGFDQIEQELHRLFVAAEREALGQELERFDLNVPRIEIDGERYGGPRPTTSALRPCEASCAMMPKGRTKSSTRCAGCAPDIRDAR